MNNDKQKKVYFLHTDPIERRTWSAGFKNAQYRVTVAGVPVGDHNKKLRVSAAVCSPQDQFSRAQGRAISAARAKEQRAYIYDIEQFTGKNITRVLAEHANKVAERIKNNVHPFWFEEKNEKTNSV